MRWADRGGQEFPLRSERFLRVCFYTETALPVIGGQELAIDALARSLPAFGHEAVVLTLRERHGAPPADDAPLPYPVVRHARFRSTRYFLSVYSRYLSSLWRRYPFDVLHCHNIYPAGYIATRWAAKRDIPVVLTSHACDISFDSHLLRKPGVAPKVAQTLAAADLLLAISSEVAERYRQLQPQAAPIERIANGVDLRRFATHVRRPANTPEFVRPGKYVLFLGRLTRQKGVDVLLDAWHLANFNTDISLIVAGAGEQRDALGEQTRRLGLQDNVHFVGQVQGDMKSYLLQNAVCTAMPSRNGEGASLVLLESYAAKRPVIGTRVPGLQQMIRDRESGWLVEPDSPSELAHALSDAVQDPERANRYGHFGWQSAGKCDWTAIAEQHLTLYQRILPKRQASAA